MEKQLLEELNSKIKDLKNAMWDASQHKEHICNRIMKGKCPECPLIALCDLFDKVYGKTVSF